MKLTAVRLNPNHLRHLYRALEERPAEACISHRSMPAKAAHQRHVRDHLPGSLTGAHPHRAWYLIEDEGETVGVIYLTNRDEIGIDVFAPYRSRGLAPIAIDILRRHHPRPRYYANIAPGNERSRQFFQRQGFKKIQETYVLEAA